MKEGCDVLLIKNCKLIDMVDLFEEPRDILTDEGKIKEVGLKIDEARYPGCRVIDARGRLVTPGLIEAHCHMGVYTTGTPEGMDGNENTNPVTPGIRGIDAVDFLDSAYDVALRHGVTTVVTGPGSGNVIGGVFLAMKTAGGVNADRVINSELCIKMALGENPKFNYGKRDKAPRTRMMSAALMRQELFKAREYREKWQAHSKALESGQPAKEFAYNLGLHSLMRVFDGMRVKIHAHQADDILTGIRVAEEFGLRYSIEHCTEGYLIADELKKKGAACILGPTVGGKGKFEVRNKSWQCAAIMEQQGVDFAVMTDHPVIPIEGQLMQLALLVKNGLSRKGALKSVTINAATITDIQDRVGSLEVGKDADLVIWNVDPLATLSEAGTVIVDGVVVFERKVGETDVDY